MRDEGKLSDSDHSNMDKFLGFILDDYKTGGMDRGEAISYLAHVMAAVDLQNYSEARNWFENHEKYIAEGKKIRRSAGG